MPQLLQRLLDDRKATVDMLQAEGGRIAQSAELADREKITGQLESLERRWTDLLSKAAARYGMGRVRRVVLFWV
jgi:hypothetical protein